MAWLFYRAKQWTVVAHVLVVEEVGASVAFAVFCGAFVALERGFVLVWIRTELADVQLLCFRGALRKLEVVPASFGGVSILIAENAMERWFLEWRCSSAGVCAVSAVSDLLKKCFNCWYRGDEWLDLLDECLHLLCQRTLSDSFVGECNDGVFEVSDHLGVAIHYFGVGLVCEDGLRFSSKGRGAFVDRLLDCLLVFQHRGDLFHRVLALCLPLDGSLGLMERVQSLNEQALKILGRLFIAVGRRGVTTTLASVARGWSFVFVVLAVPFRDFWRGGATLLASLILFAVG